MEDSRFPKFDGGLDHDREECQREHHRIEKAFKEAERLSPDDYYKRLQEIHHGML